MIILKLLMHVLFLVVDFIVGIDDTTLLKGIMQKLAGAAEQKPQPNRRAHNFVKSPKLQATSRALRHLMQLQHAEDKLCLFLGMFSSSLWSDLVYFLQSREEISTEFCVILYWKVKWKDWSALKGWCIFFHI